MDILGSAYKVLPECEYNPDTREFSFKLASNPSTLYVRTVHYNQYGYMYINFDGTTIGIDGMTTDMKPSSSRIPFANELPEDVFNLYFNERMVKCPPCKGTGSSPSNPDNQCICCHGRKSITKKHSDALKSIRADLTKRLQGED